MGASTSTRRGGYLGNHNFIDLVVNVIYHNRNLEDILPQDVLSETYYNTISTNVLDYVDMDNVHVNEVSSIRGRHEVRLVDAPEDIVHDEMKRLQDLYPYVSFTYKNGDRQLFDRVFGVYQLYDYEDDEDDEEDALGLQLTADTHQIPPAAG